ncbi:unnamed protein product [Citrullus colocynthis]|uniref:Uncharacterized protein n=1 Tax=Citrullus colocynthis TaxID=252529 RepID=A0ABP0Y462_9ROSI
MTDGVDGMISSWRTATRSMVINKAARGGGAAEAFRKAALDFIPTKNQPLSVKLRLHRLVVFCVGRGEGCNDGARGARGDATSPH